MLLLLRDLLVFFFFDFFDFCNVETELKMKSYEMFVTPHTILPHFVPKPNK